MQCKMLARQTLGLAAMLLALAACAERATAPAARAVSTTAQSIRADALRDAVERLAPTLSDAERPKALAKALAALQADLEVGQLKSAAARLERVRALVRAAHGEANGSAGADLSAIDLALDDVEVRLRAADRRRADD